MLRVGAILYVKIMSWFRGSLVGKRKKIFTVYQVFLGLFVYPFLSI